MKNFFTYHKLLRKTLGFETQLIYSKIYIYNLFVCNLNILTENMIFGFDISILGDVFKINIEWNRRRDHAGLDINICILGLRLFISFYDTRHWDNRKNKWAEYHKYI